MPDSNGRNTQIMLWIFAVIVFPTLFFIGSSVIANDKCRQDEDAKIMEEQKIDRKEQQKINQDILVLLSEIKTDLKYLKEKK